MARNLCSALLTALLLAPSLASAEEGGGLEGPAGSDAPAPPPPAEAPAEPSEPSLGDLFEALRSPMPRERVSALRALGERGDPAAVPPVAHVLRTDSSVVVRGWAVRTLAQLGTQEARSALATAAVEDPNEQVRTLAARLGGTATEGVGAAPPGPLPEPEAPEVEASPGPPEGHRLRLAGWVMLAASYGIAVITGTSLMTFGGEQLDYGWKLLLPVVGPAVAAATAHHEDDWERRDFAPASIFLWIFTGIQVTSVILLGVGYAEAAADRRAEEAGDDEERVGRGRAGPRLVLAPSGPGGLPGLSVGGWF